MPGRYVRPPNPCDKLGHHFTDDNRFSTEPCRFCGYQRAYDGSEAALDKVLKVQRNDNLIFGGIAITFMASALGTFLWPMVEVLIR